MSLNPIYMGKTSTDESLSADLNIAGSTSPLNPPSRQDTKSPEAREACAVTRNGITPEINQYNQILCIGRKNASREKEKVLLRLLLVSGNRSDISCPPEYNILQVKRAVLQNWPKGMDSPPPILLPIL